VEHIVGYAIGKKKLTAWDAIYAKERCFMENVV
jgi:hypothetical protein